MTAFKNIFIFSVLFMLLFLVGCTTVTEQEFGEVLKRCAPHGGLEVYNNPWSLSDNYIGRCICKDGIVIEDSFIKKNSPERESEK